MTPSFYDTLEKQARLTETARRWLGTPFHPHACIPNVGVDCVNLMAAIFTESGALDGWEFPAYTMDGGDHRDASQVLDWLDDHPRFQRLPTGEAVQPGDLLSFRLGRVPHHVGLLLAGNRFIHALRNYGVIESQLDDPTFGKRLVAVYRPVP
jgi:cell wall-associated NlpC family hydrolase